jgi:hypothetical protein
MGSIFVSMEKQQGDEEMKGEYIKDVRRTVGNIIKMAEELGHVITESEMAAAVGISHEELFAAMDAEQPVQDQLRAQLWGEYRWLIMEGARTQAKRHLLSEVNMIRERAREQGLEIMLSDMAERLGINAEIFAFYLQGMIDAAYEVADKLFDAYKIDVLKNITRIRHTVQMNVRPDE